MEEEKDSKQDLCFYCDENPVDKSIKHDYGICKKCEDEFEAL